MRKSRPGLTRREALARAAGAVGVAGVAAWGTSGSLRPAAAATGAVRSAYPKGVRPTKLYVVDEGSLSTPERVLAATLQGQVARARNGSGEAAGIYLNVPSVGYGVWLDDLAARYGVSLEPVDDVWALVDKLPDPARQRRPGRHLRAVPAG